MNTPLQNALGHVYGPGKNVKTEGIMPVWLEQSGSVTMGALVNPEYKVDGTHKVSDFYPKSIRTATPFKDLGGHSYCPIPTYRVLEAVTATDTVVKIAKQEGLPLLVTGMSLAKASDATKKVTVAAAAVAVDSTDGFYKLTITADDFGTLAAGDVLILEALAGDTPAGLSKDNLIYDGLDLTAVKLNVSLIDTGRVIEDTAPVVPAAMKQKLQTIKWDKIF